MPFLFRAFIRIYEFIYNSCTLRRNKIKYSSSELFNGFRGKLFIINKGIITLHNNIKINSKHSVNPIGGQSFTSIVVEENAVLEIGENVGISNSAIYCKKQIIIEKNVLLGGDCRIYDTDFHSLNYLHRAAPVDLNIISKPILIKEGVFIGAGTIILKGVTIGEYSIIGAGSVVSKNVPSNEIWAGNPVKFIRKNTN